MSQLSSCYFFCACFIAILQSFPSIKRRNVYDEFVKSMRLFKQRIKQNCYLKLFSRSNIFTDNFYVFKEDKDEGDGEDIFKRLILLKHLLWFVAASTPIKVNKLSSHRYLGWLFFESKVFHFLFFLVWTKSNDREKVGGNIPMLGHGRGRMIDRKIDKYKIALFRLSAKVWRWFGTCLSSWVQMGSR